MLDFYLIKDEQITPNSPNELESIGAIVNTVFHNLKTKGFIDNCYDYYSDFRWNTKKINQIRQNSQKHQNLEDTDLIQLFQILDMAEKKKSGIVAFGD